MPNAAVRVGRRPTEGEKESRRERAAAVAAATRGLINSEEQRSPSRVIHSYPAALSPCITVPIQPETSWAKPHYSSPPFICGHNLSSWTLERVLFRHGNIVSAMLLYLCSLLAASVSRKLRLIPWRETRIYFNSALWLLWTLMGAAWLDLNSKISPTSSGECLPMFSGDSAANLLSLRGRRANFNDVLIFLLFTGRSRSNPPWNLSQSSLQTRQWKMSLRSDLNRIPSPFRLQHRQRLPISQLEMPRRRTWKEKRVQMLHLQRLIRNLICVFLLALTRGLLNLRLQ